MRPGSREGFLEQRLLIRVCEPQLGGVSERGGSAAPQDDLGRLEGYVPSAAE